MALSDNLGEVNKLRAALDEMRPLSKQASEALWQKLRLEWNYNSNHIEGNTLTYGETMLLLLHDKTTGDHEKREYDEMQAHDVAIHMVRNWAEDKNRDLTEADIKDLNRIILVKPFWKDAITPDGQPTRREIEIGTYKQFPNTVRTKTGELFQYATPEETPQKMGEFMEWYRTTNIQHPVYLAAEMHYRFIRIHPFDDGNGRVARLLVNYILMKHGYTPIIIKSAEKEKYITALQKADAGDKSAFHDYIAEQQLYSLELELKAARGESLEEPDDLGKELTLINRTIQARELPLNKIGSGDAIIDIVLDNFYPLVREIESKVEILKASFFESKRTIKCVNSNQNEFDLPDPSEGKIHITDKLRSLQGHYLFSYINFNYALNGLKTSIEGRSIWISFSIHFNKFNYTIKMPTISSEQTYAYGVKFTDQEIKDITNGLVRNVVEQIKNSLK